MTLQEFLSLIVPQGKLVAGKLVDRVGTDGRPYKAFSHRVLDTHVDLAAALVRMDQEKLNAYFALASFEQGFHPNPVDPKKPKQLRVRTNVKALKALWFDIDFKGEYTDEKAALAALRAFLKATGMPPPTAIVRSGNGVHVYWAFDQAIELERWQRLSDALKVMAVDAEFAHPEIKPSSVDLACTADSCRVLRPFGTRNWKDPANPKSVTLLYGSQTTYPYETLEQVLQTHIGVVRRSVTPNTSAKSSSMVNESANAYSELTGGLGFPQGPPTARFDEIIKHCGVLKKQADEHGANATEPLWTASLQVLKFTEDGTMWVHPLSDGHSGYQAEATKTKWEQRLANTAGPTKCTHFMGFEPTICAGCPHKGTITSPVELGHPKPVNQPVDAWPKKFKISDDKMGMERMMIDEATKAVTWPRVLSCVVDNVKVSKAIGTGAYSFKFDHTQGGVPQGTLEMPSSMLGNQRRMQEMLADKGVVLDDAEIKQYKVLMGAWLKNLQRLRRVTNSAEKLGWIDEPSATGSKIVGFSAGTTTFYADGRVSEDVSAAADYAQIARHYVPTGGLDQWKKVAAFLADQNRPAFTAILAAAFATPLLRFTGLSGAILSIVSSASGVGKSSVLKCAQAVWGSPTHGVNAVNDTTMSVAKKLGFLNNLPAFWDELRGSKATEDFLQLAFQVTQGKERTRLDSSAKFREVQTWETMLVVASNESIFDAMGRMGNGSDAGMVRTFELVVEPFEVKDNKAALSIMFESLNSNYGYAGQEYARYISTNVDSIRTKMERTFSMLADKLEMQSQERFWFSIMASLLVGAGLAKHLGLVTININTLSQFLYETLESLRRRSQQQIALTSPAEILAAFMSHFQASAVIVDRYPKRGENSRTYVPDLTGGIPRTDTMKYQVSRSENLLRVSQGEFNDFLSRRALPVSDTLSKFQRNYKMRKFHGVLGIGTKWNTIPQHLLEFDLSKFGLSAATVAVPSSLAGMSGSHELTGHAGSTPPPSPP